MKATEPRISRGEMKNILVAIMIGSIGTNIHFTNDNEYLPTVITMSRVPIPAVNTIDSE